MKSKASSVTTATLLLLVFSATQGIAIVIPFDSRIAFNAALDADMTLTKTVEGWDIFPAGALITDLNGVSYVPSEGTAVTTDGGATVSPPNGLGSTSRFGGEPNDALNPSETVSFLFDMPIVAFGISINTFANGTGDYVLINDLGDTALSEFDPFPGVDTGQFVGFISNTPFTSVTVSGTPFAFWGLDDMTFATQVPEPTSFGVVGAALVALGLIRQRRTAAQRWNRRLLSLGLSE